MNGEIIKSKEVVLSGKGTGIFVYVTKGSVVYPAIPKDYYLRVGVGLSGSSYGYSFDTFPSSDEISRTVLLLTKLCEEFCPKFEIGLNSHPNFGRIFTDNTKIYIYPHDGLFYVVGEIIQYVLYKEKAKLWLLDKPVYHDFLKSI